MPPHTCQSGASAFLGAQLTLSASSCMEVMLPVIFSWAGLPIIYHIFLNFIKLPRTFTSPSRRRNLGRRGHAPLKHLGKQRRFAAPTLAFYPALAWEGLREALPP